MSDQSSQPYTPVPVPMQQGSREAILRTAHRSSSNRVLLSHIAWLEQELQAAHLALAERADDAERVRRLRGIIAGERP